MNILIMAPHMDDEVLGAGGTICRHLERDCRIKVCFVCNRAYNHKYEKNFIEEEKRNAVEAKKILGYQEHIFLDLNDEKLDEKLIDVILPIEKVVKEFRPKIVYLPHGGDINQDHRAVFNASMVALRSFASPYVEGIYAYESPSSTEQAPPFVENMFIPNKFMNIAQFIERKKEALGCYQREKREFPHPRSIKAIEALAIKRGVEAYCEHAEAFSVIRLIER